MIIEDRMRLAASLEEVWNFLVDIPKVSTCMPGVEDVKEVKPDVYEGTLKVKIGPVSASFGGVVSIVERVPQQHLAARVEGRDKMTSSSVTATFEADLAPAGEGAPASTELVYKMDVGMRGRLSQFGMAVFKATAKKMTAQFAECLQNNLSSGEAEPDQRLSA
jgi:carbon monoxide dehydrogenase subunit G